MSNSTNPSGIIINGNGPRDGTRVVLREITATLQNSPPIHSGLRKAASPSTQSGKSEHEVKVQFTREFVDAGSPNSRPESLSSASSFRSLASTLSTTSGNQSSPLTPQRAEGNTSYVDLDIPGLDDLIAGCGNIQLNDKFDSCVEESLDYQSIADSTLTVTANNNSIQSQSNPQNQSQEEAFASAINDSYHLNGTRDLSSDYKEASENSSSLNDTRETVLESKLRDTNFGTVKTNESITNHIPQLSVDNSHLNETRDLSIIKSNVSLNRTTELAHASDQVENKLPEVDCSSRSSDSSDNPPALIETSEPGANCNSTFNNLDLNKSDVLNLTQDIGEDRKNSSIDCHHQSGNDIGPNKSSNELSSASEADYNVSSLNDPLNLPPESNVCKEDKSVSTSNTGVLESTTNGIVTEPESYIANESLGRETDSIIQTAVKQERVEFEEESVQNTDSLSEQCIPDSSTDHSTEVTPGSTNQAETAAPSSVVPEVSVNVNAELLKEALANEETQQTSDIHNVSTTARIPEEKIDVGDKFEEPEPTQSRDTPEEAPKAVEPEAPNSTEPELESEQLQNLQNPVDQPPPKSPGKVKSLETVLPVAEPIVPFVPLQDSLNNLQELEESKSKERPQIAFNVTPFPGQNSEIYQNSTLKLEVGDQNGSSSLGEESSQTITIKEESFHSFGSEGVTENYNAFQPKKQSTSLNLDSNFLKLELAAQSIAEEIHNKSLEFTEDSDQFFNADSDIFLDGESVDFFLTRNNSKNTIRDLRAESLYVKFDPLVSNISMLPQGPPQVVEGEENAKNSIPQLKLDTPKRNPAIAAIDRLLMYSPAPPTLNKVEEPPKIEEKIVQDVISQAVPVVDETMAKELELVRATVLQLDSQLEKERKEHEDDLEKQQLKYRELEMEMAREVQKKNEMTMVMDEYEKSLSRHITDRERERASFEQERATFEQERAKLQEDLQAANHHLGNTEAAFNDVHCKYERLKSIVSAYKSNEDVLKESVQENVETIKSLEARYEKLKSHAMTQLEKANLELEAIRKQHEAETVRLQAMIRKAELKSNSLTEMVAQKSKENKQLSEILDELIARVGQTPE